MLSIREQERYSRQTILSEIGIKGQQSLAAAKVAIIGMGALGTNTAQLLTRAGIGTIILFDEDTIEESNLQRQTMFTEKDIGKSKVEAAQEILYETNSLIKIRAHKTTINEENIGLLTKTKLILDCTDNLGTRLLINKFCRDEKVPWIYAACVKTSGYVMPILPEGPCLQCFLAHTNLDSACTVGILNTIATSIAALQTTLAIQLIIGKEVEPILYHYNIWRQEFRKLTVKKNSACPVCSN